MPPPTQISRGSPGASYARNRFGNAVRTLGGVYAAPVSFSSFGTYPGVTQSFPVGTTRPLGSVDFPAYTLYQGTVVRIGFSGSVAWNGAPGGADLQIRLLIDPDSAGSPYTLALDAVSPPGGTPTHVFGGQFDLLVLDECALAADVSISALYAPVAAAPSALALRLPQGSSLGNLSLATVGSTTMTLQATLVGVNPSVGQIVLNRFVTELVGG